MMAYLQNALPLSQSEVTVFGKRHLTPRLDCFVADEGIKYGYSQTQLTPTPWPEPLLALRTKLCDWLGVPFNAVLVNVYRSGQDTMGWHADNEPELGPEPVIASVSLGALRTFKIRHNHTREVWDLALESGSCLVMHGASQSAYQHALPKRAKVATPRMNLTFRAIY